MGYEIDQFLESHDMEHEEGILSRFDIEDPYHFELSTKKVLKWLTGKSVVNPATEYVLHCIIIWPSCPLGALWDEDEY